MKWDHILKEKNIREMWICQNCTLNACCLNWIFPLLSSEWTKRGLIPGLKGPKWWWEFSSIPSPQSFLPPAPLPSCYCCHAASTIFSAASPTTSTTCENAGGGTNMALYSLELCCLDLPRSWDAWHSGDCSFFFLRLSIFPEPFPRVLHVWTICEPRSRVFGRRNPPICLWDILSCHDIASSKEVGPGGPGKRLIYQALKKTSLLALRFAHLVTYWFTLL